MNLAKAPEATVNEIPNMALMSGGVLLVAAAVMIVLAVPYLLRARQSRPVEVEGTA